MTNPNPSPELRACPFCGGEAERYTASVGVGFENRQVQCRRCGASAFDAKWQARAITPTLATVAAGDDEGVAEALDRQVRIAAWNAAKKSGATDALGYAVVEAVVAEFSAIRLLSQGAGK